MSIFNKIPVPKVKRTPHNLNNSVKFSSQFGYETPVACRKVIPGDIFAYQHAHRIDFAPLASKCLQEFRVRQEAFFVPSRILWRKFEDFFATDTDEIIHPYFSCSRIATYISNFVEEQLDRSLSSAEYENLMISYFGPRSLIRKLFGHVLTPQNNEDELVISSVSLDALKLYAYYRVLCEYYFDENLQSALIELFDQEKFETFYGNYAGDMSYYFAISFMSLSCFNYCGTEAFETIDKQVFSDLFTQQNNVFYYCTGFGLRNYPKDYFTSALPWKQKGNTVMIPQLSGQDVNAFLQNDHGVTYPAAPNFLGGVLGAQKNTNQAPDTPSGYTHVTLGQSTANNSSGVTTLNTQYMRLRTAVGSGVTSIDDFRTAYQLQQWLERNARGGTRYKEQILSHFGIKTRDSRLDRPEFLMGTTDVISHGDVFTTYQDEAGNGVPAESVTRLFGAGRSSNIQYKVSEHGYFIALFCLFPKASYARGIWREGMELDKFDYFWPEFEHLGEQEIFNCEVDSDHTNSKDVFGYTPRYAQYKCAFNDVSGEFESNLTTYTDYRRWVDPPHLNAKFIQIDANFNNLNRIFNVVTSRFDKIYIDVYNNLFMLRPMDYYGIPRLTL